MQLQTSAQAFTLRNGVILPAVTLHGGQSADIRVPVGQINSFDIGIILANDEDVDHDLGFVQVTPEAINQSHDVNNPPYAFISTSLLNQGTLPPLRSNSNIVGVARMHAPQHIGERYTIDISAQVMDLPSLQQVFFQRIVYHVIGVSSEEVTPPGSDDGDSLLQVVAIAGGLAALLFLTRDEANNY